MFSPASGVSADGIVVVGTSKSTNGNEAFRWTSTNGMEALGDFPGSYFNSVAYGISPDGSVIVGRGNTGVEDPFLWTDESGLVHLGFLPCDTWNTAFAASANGSVIVGHPNQGSGDCAFIWDVQHGIRNLHEVLVNDYGLDLNGWQLCAARAITPDGTTIVGYGINPAGNYEAWLADIKPPSLAIRRAGSQVILSWETKAAGFILEQTRFLTLSNSWSPSTAEMGVLEEHFVVTNNISTQAQFFRLQKP
jgi:probable HAF family extracellular repeat protein